jgi:predicted nucleic acid-binding protein
MPDDPERIYWDANCFTYYINGDPERIPVLVAILDSVYDSKGKKQIVTSVISKVEVAFSLEEVVQRQLRQEEEERIANLWNDVSVIAPIEVHEVIVDRARWLIRQAMLKHLSLAAADAIHLASAVHVEAATFQATFHTYDARLHNREYVSLTGIEIGPPTVDQSRLDL